MTGAGGTGRLYVNGAQVATGAMTLTPASLGATASTYIGRSQFAGDPFLSGKLDELRIWSRALSASEVLALFQNP